MIDTIKKIFVVLSCIILSSCNYLDIVPDNTIEISNLFENKEKAYQALSACYSYMPQFEKFHESMSLAGDEFCGRLDGDVAGNRGYTRGKKIMRGWQNASDPILSYWNGSGGVRSLYQGIRMCNIFLENIQVVPNLQDDERSDWTAQVKFLKAYYHFYLIRNYGPIVLVDKNKEPSASVDEVRPSRQHVDSCFSYVVNLIDEASLNLPARRGSSFYGQIDKVIAKAAKAQVLLYAASPLFNGNSEFYSKFSDSNGNLLFSMTYEPEKWKKALDATEDAIKEAHAQGKELYEYKGLVKLFDEKDWEESEIIKYAYNNRFSIVDPWNNELIWGFSGLDYEGQGAFAHGCNMRTVEEPNTPEYAWQWLGASYQMTELFYTRNGIPMEEDLTFDYENRLELTQIPDDKYHKGYMQAGENTVKLHLNREPRFYAWMVVDRCIWRTHDTKNDVKMRYNESPGGRTSSHRTDFYWSGVAIKKLVHPESKSGNWARVVKYPIPIIRLADLYLMYAEAYNEYYGPNDKVYQTLNLIRKRAGLPDIESVWNNGSIVKNTGKHTTKDGLRDIIHHERLIELSFEGHKYFDVLRWKRAEEFFTTPIMGWDVNQVDEKFYNLSPIQMREWQTPRNYLFPLPNDELNRNPNLVQNPGW